MRRTLRQRLLLLRLPPEAEPRASRRGRAPSESSPCRSVNDSSSSAAPLPEGLHPKLIVGLGNPGKSYEETRHNIGFMVVDALAARFQASFSSEKRWTSVVAKFANGWLVKPQTYMNES
ncbi:MAG: hypothetical protein KDK99_17255, partial [Verrucomicrobiales bacterium]|nr:hypothetical protein [Verrucomicrobiales bacterium]